MTEYTKRNDKLASMIQQKLEEFVAETEREFVDSGRASNQKAEAELWCNTVSYDLHCFHKLTMLSRAIQNEREMTAETNDSERARNMKEHEKELNDIKEAKIPLIEFEQKEDESIYVNTVTFHWVQGYCTNVSWNVGPANFNQFATSLISAAHNVDSKHECHIPITKVIWNAANKNVYERSIDVQMYAMAHATASESSKPNS
ncbi:hypothetical protein L5515_005007 [Caenorhabditis briggsae]|uniref:JmjC domain-containing protein n=1 Tax=Caenorhabditis briggsae TaxID=6238 RepID=A0AAE9EJ64_CAEBR|nr:hypothetical protein L5515_005007 [Caenorhabditis briggsae]